MNKRRRKKEAKRLRIWETFKKNLPPLFRQANTFIVSIKLDKKLWKQAVKETK